MSYQDKQDKSVFDEGIIDKSVTNRSVTDKSLLTKVDDKETTANALVTLTPEAQGFVKQILAQTPNAHGLRVGVKKSGCSGFGYVIDCAQEITEKDTVYLAGDVTVVIEANSLPYLKGMSIECVTEGLNKVLKFINPNATGACGCGESFSVDMGKE